MLKSKTKNRKLAIAVMGQTPCYAIISCDDKIILSFGVSVLAAWNGAEDMTGEKTSKLQKYGYKLVEGIWNIKQK